MRYAVLSVSVVAAGVLFGLYSLGAAGTPGLEAAARFVVLNAKALAVMGGLAAFTLYTRGDYLRSAWGWLTVGSALLMEADALVVTLGTTLPASTLVVLRGGVLAVANVATPVAMVLFARALSHAGLDLVGSPIGRWSFTVAAAVVAVLVAGGGIVTAARGLAAGDYTHVVGLISALGDTVALVLVAPLIHNVLALRGGSLAWPFLLLAAGRCSWLLYDGIPSVVTNGPLGAALRNGTRLWGVLFLFAAGLTQRWVTTAKVAPAVAASERRAA